MPSWSIPKTLPEKVAGQAEEATSAVERARRLLEQIFAGRPRAERDEGEPPAAA